MAGAIEVFIRFENKHQLNQSRLLMTAPNYSAVLAKAVNISGLTDEMVEFRVEEKND